MGHLLETAGDWPLRSNWATASATQTLVLLCGWWARTANVSVASSSMEGRTSDSLLLTSSPCPGRCY